MMKRLPMAVVIGLATAACTADPGGPVEGADGTSGFPYSMENLNAVLWVQTAAEYSASARQAYTLAEMMLEPALADTSWTALTEQAGQDFASLPPAVVLDVDETVLDNSPNSAREILDDRDFATDTWHEWVREEKATPVPGALEFTRAAAARGITVFYVTNRRHEVEDPTRRNLEALGFPLHDEIDTLLTRDERPDWGSDKGTRRAHVAATHRVLLQFGDNLGDFVSGVDTDVAARAALVEGHADYWGRRWIVLSNPQYGSWDGALIDFQYGASREAKREMKLDALDTAQEGDRD
jgi:acid phosphatase